MRRGWRAGQTRGPVEVSPKIFYLAFLDSLRQISTARFKAKVTKSGGVVYLDTRYSVFFGYPNLGPAAALRLAEGCAIAEALARRDPSTISLRMSTYCSSRWEPMISRPWDFLGTDELHEALVAGVQFNSVDL
jgi:hypothetical protein